MVSALLVKWFDALKKRRMEQHYLQEHVWGRNSDNPDIGEALALLHDRHYARCLDVGAGLGHYAEALAPHCDELLAIDISERAIARGKARLAHLPNITWSATNVRNLRAEKPFDLIVLADVLYYLGDERLPEAFNKTVQDIASLLAPGGHLLITTFITKGRTEQQARAYGAQFASFGLHTKHVSTFAEGKRTWVLEVLER